MEIIRRHAFTSILLALMACNVTLAQHWHDYSPPPRSFDWQLFAPVQSSEPCDRNTGDGYFGSLERSHMWLMRPSRSSVGAPLTNQPQTAFVPSQVNYFFLPVIFDPDPNVANDEIILIEDELLSNIQPFVVDGNTGVQLNSIDDAIPETMTGWGNRYEFGWVEDRRGWMVSVMDGEVNQANNYGFDDKRRDQIAATQRFDGFQGFQFLTDANGNNFLDANGDPIQILTVVTSQDPIDNSLTGQSILPIDGLNTVHVNFEDPLGLLFLPALGANIAVVFDDVATSTRMDMLGFEAMAIRRKRQLNSGATADVFVGARYLELDDQFNFFGRGGILTDTEIDQNALNRIFGPQFGLKISKRTGRWSTNIQGKVLFGSNFTAIRQRGKLGDHNSGGSIANGPLIPANLTGYDFDHRMSDETFSPVGELRIEMGCHVTKNLALKLDWSGMAAGGIARAANTVRYSLPDANGQTMGILSRSEELFVSNLSLGVQMTR